MAKGRAGFDGTCRLVSSTPKRSTGLSPCQTNGLCDGPGLSHMIRPFHLPPASYFTAGRAPGFKRCFQSQSARRSPSQLKVAEGVGLGGMARCKLTDLLYSEVWPKMGCVSTAVLARLSIECCSGPDKTNEKHP